MMSFDEAMQRLKDIHSRANNSPFDHLAFQIGYLAIVFENAEISRREWTTSNHEKDLFQREKELAIREKELLQREKELLQREKEFDPFAKQVKALRSQAKSMKKMVEPPLEPWQEDGKEGNEG